MSARAPAAPKGSVAASDSAVGGRRRHRGLQVTWFSCDALDGLEPHALGVTYWFDPPPSGGTYTVTVRLRGRRIGVKGRLGRRDSFEKVERVESVRPGTGPIAVTSRVTDVASGEWHVTSTAEAVASAPAAGRAAPVRLPKGSSAGGTAYAPVVRISAPGARLGAWPALVGVGVVCALVVQYLLGRHAGLPVLRVLGLSVLSSLVGAVGAKAYYLVEHRRERPPLLTAGMCIQGFVLAAIATLVIGAFALDVPVGELLDVTTPGLLWAMTIGRFGCFFGGCCAGRPTRSRFGLWSSNRRLGLRRIPTQLLEASLALVVGGAAATVVIADDASPPGLVFAAAMAAYTLGRQLLFPLRDLPRNTTNGRTLTLALAAAVLVAASTAIAIV